MTCCHTYVACSGRRRPRCWSGAGAAGSPLLPPTPPPEPTTRHTAPLADLGRAAGGSVFRPRTAEARAATTSAGPRERDDEDAFRINSLGQQKGDALLNTPRLTRTGAGNQADMGMKVPRRFGLSLDGGRNEGRGWWHRVRLPIFSGLYRRGSLMEAIPDSRRAGSTAQPAGAGIRY